MPESCEHPCGSIRCETYGCAQRPTRTSPDPSSRLGEIRARSERGSAWWLDPISDARWLLEHVEQLQSEVADRDTSLEDGTERYLAESHAWEAQRQAVLNLCDKATTRPRGRGGLELVVPVGAVRKALGADDDR